MPLMLTWAVTSTFREMGTHLNGLSLPNTGLHSTIYLAWFLLLHVWLDKKHKAENVTIFELCVDSYLELTEREKTGESQRRDYL